MKKIVITTLLALAFPAMARIGETPAECIKRYGEAVKINREDNSMSFVKSGFFIHVVFLEGKAGQLFVCKNEQDALGNFKEMSEAEIEALLKSNRGEGEWKKEEQLIDINPRWMNQKEKRVAQYNSIENTLVFVTVEFAERQAAKKEAAEKENLEGF
jgi:hypothetical protein